MPYPILKMSYGLQKRLRSLATKKELYYLQIAIGFEKNYILPLQMCITLPKDNDNTSRLHLHSYDGHMVLSTECQIFPGVDPINWETENLTLVQDKFFMYHFEPAHYDHPIFDYLILHCSYVEMNFGSTLTAQTLEKFKSCDGLKSIKHLYASYCCSELSLFSILDTLSNLKVFCVEFGNYAYKNWIQDVLKLGKRGLLSLAISGSYENLFSFELMELKQLFEMQSSEFDLTLLCYDALEVAENEIRRMLEPQFEEFTNTEGPFDGSLQIELHNTANPNNIVQMYFQVGPKPNRVDLS